MVTRETSKSPEHLLTKKLIHFHIFLQLSFQEDTVNLLKESLKNHKSAKAFLIEGFPRNKEQVEAFNKHVSNLRI